MNPITKADIALQQKFTTKEQAIRETGALLVKRGYVKESYIEKMIERDELTSVYIGNQVAIPHGSDGSQDDILRSGIVVLQVPDGVNFNGNETNVLVGIAGKGNEHLALLSNIAIVCSKIENVEKIIKATTEQEICNLFGGKIND